MTDLRKAFAIGCKLAMCKFADDNNIEVEALTEKLDSILKNKPITSSKSVLDSTERASSASWGDKMELETPKNTGINV